MKAPRATGSLVASVLGSALLVGACTLAPADARIGIDEPSRAEFPPVADFLDHRCGSLDCHGSMQRNLVIYGSDGLRLEPDGGPVLVPGGTRTTVAEYDATFRSLVGLEPTVMSEVVAGGGQHPEALTFVRKARGEEAHKGGALITPGDDQDVCITSWLQGNVNTTACQNALNTP